MMSDGHNVQEGRKWGIGKYGEVGEIVGSAGESDGKRGKMT
jgi:hypothetical protein